MTRIFNRNNLAKNNNFDYVAEYPMVNKECIIFVDRYGNSIKYGIPPYNDVVLLTGTLEFAKIEYDTSMRKWKIHQFNESTIEDLNYQIMMYEFRLSNHVNWGGSEEITKKRLYNIMLKYNDMYPNRLNLPLPEVIELMDIDELISNILAQIANGEIMCKKDEAIFRKSLSIRGSVADYFHLKFTCKDFTCSRKHVKNLKCAYMAKQCKIVQCSRRHRG